MTDPEVDKTVEEMCVVCHHCTMYSLNTQRISLRLKVHNNHKITSLEDK